MREIYKRYNEEIYFMEVFIMKKKFKKWSNKPITNGSMLKSYIVGSIIGLIGSVVYVRSIFKMWE